MTVRPYRILILCTGNSARSIMAEGLFNRLGAGRCVAFSAGSQPTGKVNPFAVAQLSATGHATDTLRSKSWHEFATADAQPMDFIITVCDNAAGETCPLWPGQPVTAHWGFADPAAVTGSDAERQAAFARIYAQIERKVQRLLALPLENLSRDAIVDALRQIGEAPV